MDAGIFPDRLNWHKGPFKLSHSRAD